MDATNRADHNQPNRNVRYMGIAVVVLLALVPAAVIGVRLTSAWSSFAEAPKPPKVGIVQSTNGVEMTLDSVTNTEVETRLSFTVALPEAAVTSPVPDILGPLFPGRQYTVEGFTSSSSTNIEMKPHQSGDASLTFTLILGPVIDPSHGASVTFLELPFSSKGNDHFTVQGPWTFSVEPSMLDGSEANVFQIDQSITKGGVTIHVDSVSLREAAFNVHFAITSGRSVPFEMVDTGAKLLFDDGSTASADRLDTIGGDDSVINPGQTVAFVSGFPPLREPTLHAQLVFGLFVTSNEMPASVTVHDPFGEWSAEPLTINGEPLKVTQVTYDDVTESLTVVVENTLPVTSASVMFGGVMAPATATDSQGNTYQATSYSNGMRQDDDGNIGAGAATYSFSGIDPKITDLTVTTDYSGIIIRVPESIAIDIP